MNTVIDPAAAARAEYWLNSPIEEADKEAIRRLRDRDPAAFSEAFYTELEFGTGGLRGLMRLGSNGMNRYTVGLATQGLANYVLEASATPSVAIAFDSRNQSPEFAREAAEVLAANGVNVWLFDELRPTPELSFAVRLHGCTAGIVITASHNPKEYNGYKVYWSDGGQIVPPNDRALLAMVRSVTLADVKRSGGSGVIRPLGRETDEAYLGALESLSLNRQGNNRLGIVFTALHGTSVTLLPESLRRWGFSHVDVLEAQAKPDGNFPTVHSPNPEESAALALAVARAEELDYDFVVGCDPDSDRVGIAVRDDEGDHVLLNGNQAAAVLMDYVLAQRTAQGSMPDKPFVATTVVTSPLLLRIAEHYRIEAAETLTGFKWIAEQIRLREGKQTFVVGGEESYGYLAGDFVRDKDAIGSACLLAEAAAYHASQGSSFYRALLGLYARHGVHQDELLSVTKPGRSGLEEIQAIMTRLRANPPREVAGLDVAEIVDYQEQTRTNLMSGAVKPVALPKSNVIQLLLANGDRITARPSGTEPKIKYYFNVVGSHLDEADLAGQYRRVGAELAARVEAYREELKKY
ncbi:MAG: phospho-sugar mutase [Cryomorphaceae bacterium]|jgi:phosphoglucomutase|nr:phospho-sugar mutase [Cryomorphaceae bacterium]